MNNTTHLLITVPSGVFYEGDVNIVTLKTASGYIGLQANRTPLFSNIEICNLSIKPENGEEIRCYIGGGLVYADEKKVSIITDDIINVKNIDVQRALRDRDKLIKQIEEASHNDSVNKTKLESKLKKALFKIDAYNLFNK
ncbi:ATP synthase F1 subunit epsilon [Mycoplasma sp. 2045]|uniref:ATP synthase F1 subunit epsilon n=1 Tax=unclassified Mycoplasma TaxID=2683645 RepID=UPI00211BF31F|nr:MULTISPECIES: ATP synthase F1 subunit epsilon [unclassified Mycoplasma]MEA4134428.1 ATP synthase F1 subunit epsilon [Mycoplasma sp. 2704]MEA4191329.1 ATP synthase F1 subunit epsilon [Mycoplasma sp. 2248]MEA4206073.1 ATP synthase F1 subunit epsilon [Mycoplasma sp. 1199]MEA4276471.1 ATP synthase F1 subunit epsilon [Mycoplasma sp. 21DD0573]MEA4333422.1 ATP synthase F1 subunit epsilon [Mycoplasma sp. 1232]